MTKRGIEHGNSDARTDIILYLPLTLKDHGIVQQSRCNPQQHDPGQVKDRNQRRHYIEGNGHGRLVASIGTIQIRQNAFIAR